MMQGKILKGISGFYYVHVAESGIYECKAKGVFRQQKIKPLVGDDVEIAVIDDVQKTGNIEQILTRRNELIRPAVANIDLALVIFAAARPEPNLNLLDRFLILMEMQQIPVTICFNKMDLVGEEERHSLSEIYEKAGYQVIFTSAKKLLGLEELYAMLSGKTASVAGPSGAGKSSIVNWLQPGAGMETGELSKKISRGKQTTRHTQLIHVRDHTYIMDTPGFSSLFLPQMEKEELWQYYPEFQKYEPYCRFQGCSHIQEPDCGVKNALSKKQISVQRYENYCRLYEELKDRRKY